MTDTTLSHHRREPYDMADTDWLKVSWGAVFAGVAIALTVQLLLNLLGVGVGAAVIDPGTADNPDASTFSILGALWYVVAGIIGALAGGWVSSRLSGSPVKTTGAFHGLAVWAVATLVVMFLLTTSVGAIVGGAFSGLQSVIGGVGQTAATVAEAAAPSIAKAADPMADIERQIRSATGGSDPEALRTAAVTAVQAVLTGDESQAEAAQTRAAEALARARNIPVDQALAQVRDYESSYRAAVDKAKQEAIAAADTATKVISRGALLGFLALALGAAAAWFGGIAGTVPVAPVVAPARRDVR